jgi:hypothetical protein
MPLCCTLLLPLEMCVLLNVSPLSLPVLTSVAFWLVLTLRL